MIKLAENFSAHWDGYCWRLEETYASVDRKTGEEKKASRITYHPSLEAVAHKVVDRNVQLSENAEEIMTRLEKVKAEITEAILGGGRGVGSKEYSPSLS